MFKKLLGRQHRMSQGGGRVNSREYYVPSGTMLAQRYEVLDRLGEGGFSRTYIAGDNLRPGKPRCVVKHLQPANSDPEFLQDAWRLFQQEAEILERLGSHDQIPRLLAYFRDGQEFYLVQEFIPGEPLSAQLIEGQPWTERQVYQLLLETLTVLKFVHDRQVIHRDLKPDNLICRQDDRKLVLVDFGAVKQIRRSPLVHQGHTSVTISVGTIGYMPPEQFSGKPKPSSDIYALGIVAIQALTGMPLEAFKDDLEADETSWRSQATVSPSIAEFVTKMVRYRARERYQSAAEALEDLLLLSEVAAEVTVVSPELIVPEPQSAIDSSKLQNPILELPATAVEPEASFVDQSSTHNVEESSIDTALHSDIPIDQAQLSDIDQSSSLAVESLTNARSQQVVSQVNPPHPRRRTAIWLGTGVVCAIASLTFFFRQNHPQPTLPASSQSIQPPAPAPRDHDQEAFDQATSIAQNGRLEQAIQKIQTIPDASPIHAKAQEKAFSWQATLIENYLRSEVPKQNPKLKELIEAIKPTIVKLNAEQITLRYDSSAHADFSTDQGLKIITSLFMGRLRGNPKETIAPYKNLNFKQLAVSSQQGDHKAVLTADDWDTYVKSNANEEAIYEKVKIAVR